MYVVRALRLSLLALFAAAAHAAPPVIVNSASQSHWLETPSLSRQVRNATVSFVVRHDSHVSIIGLAIDGNYDGTDNTGSAGVTAVFAERLAGVPYTRVTATFTLPEPAGFSCPFLGGATRRMDRPVRFAIVDSSGQRSASLSGTIHFVEVTNCSSIQDYPRIFNQIQNLVTVAPGQNVTFGFVAEDPDPDVFSSDDDADAIEWRMRNLMEGSVSGATLVTGLNDNSSRNINVSFPRRGRWVVEARVRNENGNFPDPNAWWRLGAVDVNSTQPPALGLSAAALSVNAGQPLTINASASDTDASSTGRVQVIEWDAQGDGVFERREFTTETQNVFGAMLQQAVDTSTFGLRTIRARVYDNGAMSAADNIRRSTTASTQVRVNAIPIANNRTVGASEDTAITFDLIGADPDHQPVLLTFERLSQPSRGTVSCSAGGQCTYTPQPNSNGPDSFTFRASDGPSGSAWSFSNTATVTINVVPVNDAPVAANVAAATNENTAVPINLVAVDPDNPTLTFAVATQPANGSVSCSGNVCTYTPTTDYNGTDSFTYTASDGNATSAPATVSINISAVNSVPVASDLAITTDEDTSVTFTPPASDADSATLAIVANDPQHGSVECDTATCTYTPGANFFGTDTFTYRATDPDGLSDEGTVTVTVTPVNDPPVAANVEAITDEDTAASFEVAATDADDANLTFTPSDPDHGTASCSGATCTYTPDEDFFGSDSFAVIVGDGSGGSATSVVSVTVNGVNDAPDAQDMLVETGEDTPVTFTPPASDADGSFILIADDPGHGTISCGDATCTYTPDANYFGSDSFTYTATDGDGASDSGTIAVEIAPVNDGPVAEDVDAATDEDTPLDILIPAADLDDVDLTYTVMQAPAHGVATCDLSTCTYTPDANVFGGDAFVVRVSDSAGVSADSRATVTIRPVNDAPVAADTAINTDEDTPVTFTPSASDVDSATVTLTASDPAHGSVVCGADTCAYTSDANFFGTDTFTYIAADGELSDTGTVSVTINPVNDVPTINCSGNVSRNTDAGVCSASVNLPVTGTDVEDGSLTGSCTRSDGAAAGSPFPLGTTSVHCSVTDVAGASASCSFEVTVADAERPSIIAPPAVSVSTAADACSATLNDLGIASATDACGTVTVTRRGVPANNVFPIGVTTVTYMATDAAGNTAEATQAIEVRDATLPIVTASLTPVGNVPKSHGDFRASFTAHDECGLGSTVAVMSVPAMVRDFAVRFANGGQDTVIRIDLDRREISLAGQNDAEKSRLLAEILGDGGIRVANDQVVRIDADRHGRQLELRFDRGVLARMQVPLPELRVIATDNHGNVAAASAIATFR